jgi:peroxiredoxin
MNIGTIKTGSGFFMRRRGLGGALLSSAALLFCIADPWSVSLGQGPSQIGGKAPDFTLPAVRGGSFQLHAPTPQAALLAFLETIPDTADTPSRSEVALLQSMSRQYSARGLRVVIIDASALAAGHQSAHNALINTSYDWNLQIPLLEDDSEGVARLFGIAHAPTTILIAANGQIAQRWERPMAPGDLAIAIEKALGGGPLVPLQKAADAR